MAQHAYHPYPLPMGGPDEAMLLARLQAQVEFYFSPQNLARDTFLTSLLKQYGNAVPLETIANFPKVRELHAIGRLGMVNVPRHAMPPADPFLLCRALEGSLVVTVSNNGQWIHLNNSMEPNVQHHDHHGKASPNQEYAGETTTNKSLPSSPSTTASSAGVPTHPIELKERMTLIAQHVPQDVTREEILTAFSTNAYSPKDANPNHGDNNTTWLVTFCSEKEAMAALAATHNQTIRGMPIQASIRNEGVVIPAAPLPPPQLIPMHQHHAYPVMLQGYPVPDASYYGPPVVPQHYYNGYGMPVPPQQHVIYAPPQQQQHMQPAAYVSDPRYLHGNNGYAMPVVHDMRSNHNHLNNNRGRGRGNNNNNRNRHANDYYDIHTSRDHNGDYEAKNYDETTGAYHNHDHHQHGQNRNVASEETCFHEQNVNRNDGSFVNTNTDGFSRKKRHPKKNRRKQQDTSAERLHQDQFPALNGGKKTSTTAITADGYAAALKKQPKASGTTAAEQTVESSVQLEQDMTKLRVSNTVDTEPDVWEADESSSAEMW